MTDDDPPICPCCNKPVPPDKIAAFKRNMARFIADSPGDQELREAIGRFQTKHDLPRLQ